MEFKKISYGIDHNIPIDDQKWFLKKYQDYIASIFLGLPDKELNQFFTGRVYNFLNSYDQKYYDEIIDYAKSLRIKLNFTLNSANKINETGLSKFDFYSTEKDDAIIDKYLNKALDLINYYNPSELCIRDLYLDFFKSNTKNIKLIRTFYEGYLNKENLDLYDCFVIRNTYFYSKHQILKNKEYRIALNLACPISCPGCRVKLNDGLNNDAKSHITRFNNEFKANNNSIEKYLATHIWLGKDVDLFESSFKDLNYSYKLANRGININLQSNINLIENYISGSDKLNINNIKEIICFSNDFGLINYIDNNGLNNFDIQKFKNEKIKYWNIINSK